MDPHFHNLGPNNSMTKHIFDRIVDQDENQIVKPMLASSWKTLDETTWEFKLRAEREIQRRLGLHRERRDLHLLPRAEGRELALLDGDQCARHHRHDGARSADLADQDREPAPAAAERDFATSASSPPRRTAPGAVTFDRQECKGVGTFPKTEAFNSGQAAIGTGPYKLSRFTKGDRVILERNESYWGEKPAWQRIIFRPITSAGPRVAALLSGDVDLIENVPIQDLNRDQAECRLQGGAGPVEPRDLPALQLSRRHPARRRRRRQEPVPRQARARRDLQGDRSRRDRRAHHGRRRGAGRRAAAERDVRRQQGHGRAQAGRGRRQEAARRGRLPERLYARRSRRRTTATSTMRRSRRRWRRC